MKYFQYQKNFLISFDLTSSFKNIICLTLKFSWGSPTLLFLNLTLQGWLADWPNILLPKNPLVGFLRSKKYSGILVKKRCGGLVVSVPASRSPSPVWISSQGLPTVWSEGQQIAQQYCTNNVIKIPRPQWAEQNIF